jgi:UDP-glucose 4-epimerase
MCKALHRLGHQVVVLDNHSTSPDQNVHTFGHFYRGDIADGSLVAEVLKKHRFEAVFHFAARSIVNESEEKPFLYLEDNTRKSTLFFESLVKSGVKNLVFSSTSSVYGSQPDTDFLDEDSPTRPSNAYALSKKLLEDVLMYLAPKYGLNVGILRYFNVAGSDPEFEIGENHLPETHLIPRLVLSHLNQEELQFQLFGDQHPTKDGTCVRDYIHVNDLVRAHYRTYEYLLRHPGAPIFNLGSGRGYSVKEVIQVFEKVIGAKIHYVTAPPRHQDPPRLVCRTDKAARELGFTNEYDLEDCVRHCLGYLKSRGALNESKN